jgi:hypothetical protein
MAKDQSWPVRVPQQTAQLLDRIKRECGHSGRDDVIFDALSTLVSIKTGKGLPPFIEDLKLRRQEFLAKQESIRREQKRDGERNEGGNCAEAGEPDPSAYRDG